MAFALLALAASAATIVFLWAGWRHGSTWRHPVGAIVSLAIATASWIASAGVEIGIPLLLETSALLAFAFILTRIERRPERVRAARINTAPPPVRRRWLGVARFSVAGPLGLVAALGVGLMVATRAPAAEQTRIIIGGLIVPSLWACAIGWIVASHRLSLQAGTLAALGAAGFAIALLGGAA